MLAQVRTWIVNGRALATPWVAEVTSLPCAAEAPDRTCESGEILAKPDQVAQHLAPEDARALHERVVGAAAELNCSLEDRGAKVGCPAPREATPDAPDRLNHVGI
jgi:hypothetical protein